LYPDRSFFAGEFWYVVDIKVDHDRRACLTCPPQEETRSAIAFHPTKIESEMKRQMGFEVPESAEGTAVADFLAVRFPYHDRTGWCDRIAAGAVTVNDRPCILETLLRTGDRLSYEPDDRPEPPVDFNIGIISDDDDLLLINKSGNLPCHPGGRYFNHTLWAWLKKEQGLNDFTFVNRIDRETSGLVVIAKNFAASENCRKQFSGRKVVKRYKALVEARNFPEELEAAGWLVADTDSAIRKKRKFIQVEGRDASPRRPPVLNTVEEQTARRSVPTNPPSADAEWAETKFRLLKQCNGIALIEAEPHTGRLHQIRATLLALGTPIVGDKLYGVDETLFLRFCKDTLTDADRARLRMDRQALHAAGLSFRHPKFGRPVTVELDLPNDMQKLLDDSNS
jgi:23S rRNA pseudouridine955/2504/2580 synthase/23S rRNA pseudouridine1911/1915/1917 synthase